MIKKMRYHYLKTESGHAVACMTVKSKREGVLAVGISVRSKRETTWNKKQMRNIAAGRCDVQFDHEIKTGENRGGIILGRISKAVCPLKSLGIRTHPLAGVHPSQERMVAALKPLMDFDYMTIALAGQISEDGYWAAMKGELTDEQKKRRPGQNNRTDRQGDDR